MKLLTTTIEDLDVLKKKFDDVTLSTKRYGLDYETFPKDGVKDHATEHDLLEVLGIGFGFEDGDRTYIPLRHTYGDNAPMDAAMEVLRYALMNPELEMWAHNAKFEWIVSRVLGITPKNKIRCSMIAQWLLGYRLPGKAGLKLKPAVKKFLNHKMLEWDDVVPKRTRAQDVLPTIMGDYCSDDGLQCLRLGIHFLPEIEELKMTKVFTDLEMPFMPVLAHMKEVGFRLDFDRLRSLHEKFKVEMQDLADQFEDLVGVGISKNQQISQKLYDELKWWPSDGFERGKNGCFSIDKAHLEILEKRLEEGTTPYQVLEMKRRYQKISKINSTYTTSLIEKAEAHGDERLRGDFHQAGTDTSRLSSSKPNLQQMPSRDKEGKKVREAFIAEDGWWICDADYSQADLVMMAHLSQDPMLLKAYREHLDLHQQTADEAEAECNFEVPRPTGKVLNLGLIYEMSVNKLQETLKCDRPTAAALHKAWHRTYPLVGAYHRRMHKYVAQHKFVRTITGRIRRIPDIDSKTGWKKAKAERTASNTPDQGSVADVVKIAMRNLYYHWLDSGVLYDYYTKEGKAKILSQVHDELICELREDFVEEGMRDIKHHLENAVELRAPMSAQPGVGRTWSEAKADAGRREKIAKKGWDEVDTVLREKYFEEAMRWTP